MHCNVIWANRWSVLCIISLFTASVVTSSNAGNVPLAVFTSDVVQLAPAKIGNSVSAEILSRTTLASISENVEKFVLIVLPKLSFTRLAYDANYNNQKDTRFLTNALDKMSSVLYPAVSNIDRLSVGVTSEAFQIKSLDELTRALVIDSSNKLNIKLDAALSLHDADAIFGLVIKHLNESGKSFSVILTADQPDDWVSGIRVNIENSAELHTIKDEAVIRYKRQVSNRKKPAKQDSSAEKMLTDDKINSTIISYAGSCFLLYARNIDVAIQNLTTSKKAVATLPKIFRNITDGKCIDEKQTRLDFSIKVDYGAVGNFSGLEVQYDVKMKNAWEWIVDNITLYYKADSLGEGSVTLKPDWLTAQKEFSFHCNLPDPATLSRRDDKYKTFRAEMRFDTIQVQAYDAYDDKFGWQCDCVGFFTSAIWAGIVVSAIYLLIIALALVMLMNLETMDRFEDPKGQGLKIQASG